MVGRNAPTSLTKRDSSTASNQARKIQASTNSTIAQQNNFNLIVQNLQSSQGAGGQSAFSTMGLTSVSTNPLAGVSAGSALGGSSKKLNKKRAQS